jgi:SAM-dependent methyltransferase
MSQDWWKTFFNKDYLDFWSARDTFKGTKKEVNFLIKRIPLKKNHQILDLCCGHGRHTLELAKRGFQVEGLDYSKYELDLLKEEAVKRKLKLQIYQKDARSFNLAKKYDVILNLFTAFGYGTKGEDRKILKNVNKHLKPGGRFFIDVMHLTWLLRNYKLASDHKFGNLREVSTRHFDFLTNTNHESRILYRGRNKKVSKNSLHVYSLHELRELLESEGFKVLKFWGSFKGQPLSLDSKRLIVLAKKV